MFLIEGRTLPGPRSGVGSFQNHDLLRLAGWDCLGDLSGGRDCLFSLLLSVSLFFSWIMAIQFAWQEDDLGCLSLYIYRRCFQTSDCSALLLPPPIPDFASRGDPAQATSGCTC